MNHSASGSPYFISICKRVFSQVKIHASYRMKHEYTYFRLGCPCFCVRFGGCSGNVLSCPVLFSILFPRVIIYYNVSVRFPFPAFCNVSVCVTSCFPEFACACHKENFKKVPRSFCVSEKVCTFASAFGSDPSVREAIIEEM